MPIALVASLPGGILALALLLVLYATKTLWVEPLAQLLGHLPVVGGAIADAVRNGLAGLLSWAQGWAQTGLDAIVQIVHVPLDAIVQLVNDVVQGVEAAAAAIVTIFDRLYNIAGSLVADVLALYDRIASVAATIPAAVNGAIGFLQRWAQNAIAVALAPIHAIVNGATTLIHALVTQEAATRNAADQSILGQVANQGVALERSFAQAIGATAGTLEGDIGQLGVKVDGVLGLLAPALAVGGLGVIVTELTRTLRFVDDCGQPMCNALGNGLQAFQSLSTLAMMASVGAMVADAVADPEGAARTAAGVVGGMESIVGGLVGEFAGIHV